MILRLSEDKVAIEPIFDAAKIGSIWVPDQAKGRCKQGIVKYIGPKVTWLQPGDFALFGAYSGTLVQIDQELLIIVKEDFVEAVVDISESIDIPGLWFKGRSPNGGIEYFQANYEAALKLMAEGIQRSEFYTKVSPEQKKMWEIKTRYPDSNKTDTDYVDLTPKYKND